MNIQVIIRFDNYAQCYTYVFVMFISTYINVSMFITIYTYDKNYIFKPVKIKIYMMDLNGTYLLDKTTT